MGDEEGALKKRKREQEQRRRALQAMELSDDDDRRSDASTEATAEAEAEDEALGRERAAVRRLLEPLAREQLLEILASAYVRVAVWA